MENNLIKTAFFTFFSLLGLNIPQLLSQDKIDESEKIQEFIRLKEIQMTSQVRMFMSFEEETKRKNAFNKFNDEFKKLLEEKQTITYPFDSLKNVSKLSQKEDKFRIYTWSYPNRDGTYQYFGMIQIKNKNGQKLIELKDQSQNIMQKNDVFFEKLSSKKWFGCMYYSLIEKELKGKKIYTLIGWDGNNVYTQKKIVETLYLTAENKAFFGLPLFDIKKDYQRLRIQKQEKRPPVRLIYEYSGKVSMKLTYNLELDVIVMDNLGSFQREIKGDPRFFAPDLTYNVLSFIKDKWVLRKNVKLKTIRKERDIEKE